MNKNKDKHLYFLAWTIIVGFLSLCVILMFKNIPKESSNVLYILLGGLSAGFSQVLSYFFGSSKSSAEKNQLLVNNNKKQGNSK